MSPARTSHNNLRSRFTITVPALSFIVEPYLSGVRIDTFLQRQLRNYTTWRIYRMVENGAAEVNDLAAQANQRVFRGQTVKIRLLEPPDKLLTPEKIALDIVYEDPWLMVIGKPVGIVAHPVGEYQDATLSNALQHHLDQQTVARGLLRPGIVHRLDRMTSGLIVVTKDHLAHRRLSLDFQANRPQKTYVALAHGRAEFESREINVPIGVDPSGSSVLMSTSSDARKKRQARTDVTVLQRGREMTLFSCRLHTGRNHQIRVHLAHIGQSIVGDEFYGGESTSGYSRHALHASELTFEHPILQTELTFRSQIPEDMAIMLPDELRGVSADG